MDDVVVGVGFVVREMHHETVRGGAVLLLLVGLEQEAVAGANDLDGTAAVLA